MHIARLEKAGMRKVCHTCRYSFIGNYFHRRTGEWLLEWFFSLENFSVSIQSQLQLLFQTVSEQRHLHYNRFGTSLLCSLFVVYFEWALKKWSLSFAIIQWFEFNGMRNVNWAQKSTAHWRYYWIQMKKSKNFAWKKKNTFCLQHTAERSQCGRFTFVEPYVKIQLTEITQWNHIHSPPINLVFLIFCTDLQCNLSV